MQENFSGTFVVPKSTRQLFSGKPGRRNKFYKKKNFKPSFLITTININRTYLTSTHDLTLALSQYVHIYSGYCEDKNLRPFDSCAQLSRIC